MAEHYCKIHNTVFFKKGKMKGFAHPIGDTGEWCNEEESQEETGRSSSETPEPSDRQTSIEAQNAYTGVVALMTNKIIDNYHPLAQSALNYAASKLSRWSSVGESPTIQTEPKGEELATAEQIKKLNATAKKQGYDPALAVSIMTRLWNKSSSKALTKREADEFIAVMEQGKYLEETF